MIHKEKAAELYALSVDDQSQRIAFKAGVEWVEELVRKQLNRLYALAKDYPNSPDVEAEIAALTDLDYEINHIVTGD